MSFAPTRVVSAATATYGVFALVRPQHLPDALGASGADHAALVGLTKALGARDLVIGLAGAVGSRRVRRLALGARIAADVADAVILPARAGDEAGRTKVLGVALGWATLNAAVLAADLKRG